MIEARSLKRTIVAVASALSTVGLIVGNISSAQFDGNPSTPRPVSGGYIDPDGTVFDIQVHERGSRGASLPSMNAQHGADCAGPPATHPVNSVSGAVFNCRDHLMTALNGNEYGMIYLTPNRMLDFASSGTVRFDVSTGDQSRRDWIDLWVTPYGDNIALPLQPDLPDAQGEPRNGLHLQQDFSDNSWHLAVFRNGVRTEYGGGLNANTSGAFVPDFARRDTMQVVITPTRVTLTMPQYGLTLVDRTFATLPFTQGVVQFGHHSYDPTKDGSGSPNTWHWDNFSIDPAIPFSIVKAGGPNYIQNGTGTVTFPAAPAGAELRFAAIGPSVRVNGQVVQPRLDHDQLENVASYSVPIPAGSTSATVRVDESPWCGGHTCQAKDFHLWSLTGSPPVSTPIPTNTATPTSTTTVSVTPTNTPGGQSVGIAGEVVVEGRRSGAGVQVRAMPSGASATTGADGAFVITGLQPNQPYSITASLDGFLDARRAGISVANGTANLPQTVLRAGDIDGDSFVTVTDVSMVAGLYGTLASGSIADLNGNGAIDVTDVSLTAGNYSMSGPTSW